MKLLMIREAVRIYKISEKRLQKAVIDGSLPSEKIKVTEGPHGIRGRWIAHFSESDLMKWLNKKPTVIHREGPKLITVLGAVEKYGISERQLRAAINGGHIPVTRLLAEVQTQGVKGRLMRHMLEKDLKAWLAKREELHGRRRGPVKGHIWARTGQKHQPKQAMEA